MSELLRDVASARLIRIAAAMGMDRVSQLDSLTARDWMGIDGATSAWCVGRKTLYEIVELLRAEGRDSFESAKLTTGEFNEP